LKGSKVKTDWQLKRDVMDELAWDPAISANAIGVAVKDGVVTVSGHLDTFAEKVAVQRAVRRVTGVRAIAIELDVKLAPQHKRSDTEIAAAAEHALRWNTMIPADKVRVTVEQGWVQLNGEVEWDYQRQAAFKAVRSLTGVVGVSNEITLGQRTTPADLAQRIQDALERQALREANRVQVTVADGTVTLQGNVHSSQERDAVQGAAWSAPGVRSVVNQLTLG
jgi:osmotically-inducible protein OsmY